MRAVVNSLHEAPRHRDPLYRGCTDRMPFRQNDGHWGHDDVTPWLESCCFLIYTRRCSGINNSSSCQQRYYESIVVLRDAKASLVRIGLAMISDPLMCMVGWGGGCCYSMERTPIKSHRDKSISDGDGLSPLLVNKPLRKQHDVAKKLEKKEEGICSLFFGFLQSTKQIPSFFCHFSN